jgi:hypothetical protein
MWIFFFLKMVQLSWSDHDIADLFVGFYDRRLNSTNTFFHTFGAVADVTSNPPVFGTNFQISEVGSFAEDFGGQVRADYDQATADNVYLYYSWTDQRRPFKIPAGFYFREQDVRYIRVADK